MTTRKQLKEIIKYETNKNVLAAAKKSLKRREQRKRRDMFGFGNFGF